MVNFEHISLLSSISIVAFEQVNVSGEASLSLMIFVNVVFKFHFITEHLSPLYLHLFLPRFNCFI